MISATMKLATDLARSPAKLFPAAIDNSDIMIKARLSYEYEKAIPENTAQSIARCLDSLYTNTIYNKMKGKKDDNECIPKLTTVQGRSNGIEKMVQIPNHIPVLFPKILLATLI